MGSRPPGGRLGTGTQASPFWASLSESTAPHHPLLLPHLGINPGTVLIPQPCLLFLALLPSSQETVQGLHGRLAEGWIGQQVQESLSSVGWGKETPAC